MSSRSSSSASPSTISSAKSSIEAKVYDIPNELSQFPYIHQQVVAWGDMDAFNHVNNVMYYRYVESARIAYLHHLEMFSTNVTTVIAKSECRYLIPVEFPDTLLIGTRTKKLGNTSLVMEYHYYSTAQQKVVATGEAVLVRLSVSDGKSVAWSIDERQQIIDFEATAHHHID